MPKPLQTSASYFPEHLLMCMGDSYTRNPNFTVLEDEFWPHWLELALQAAGKPVAACNRGISGNRTDQMVARAASMLSIGQPKVCAILAGANDPAGGLTAIQTTANLRSMVKLVKNGAAAIVASQASLPAGVPEGTRYIVTSDTSTTGGLAAAGTGPATVTGTTGGVQCWISRNTLAGEAGWSRVADLALTEWFLLIAPMFINLASGADTANAGGSHAGQNATSNGIHNAVAAAVTAEAAQDGGKTLLVDLFDYEQRLILSGHDAPNSWTWHVASNNEHRSAYGGKVIADAIMERIGTVPELLADLEPTGETE